MSIQIKRPPTFAIPINKTYIQCSTMVAWVHWISLLVLTFWLVLVGAEIPYAPQEGGGRKREESLNHHQQSERW